MKIVSWLNSLSVCPYQQTPPRNLTLDNHYFPTADEEDPPVYSNEIVKSMDAPKTYNAETQITRHVRYRTFHIIRIEPVV